MHSERGTEMTEITDEEIRRIAAKLGAPVPTLKSAPRGLPKYEVVLVGRGAHIMKIVGGKRSFLQTVSTVEAAWQIVRRLKEQDAAEATKA